MTLWTPDTCSCQIEFSDDGLFTQGHIHAVCAKHAGVDPTTLLATLFAHNRQKNSVLNWLAGKYNINLHSEALALRVGYDSAAAMNNDPVLVHGLTTVAPVAVPTANAAASVQFGHNVVKILS